MNNWGKDGELKAKKYLQRRGYRILECNYTTTIGEIDIIAKFFNKIIFVEVKYRKDTTFGYPRESVTIHKQNKIKLVAQTYLKQKNLYNKNIRFDVIEILGDKITHIINVF